MRPRSNIYHTEQVNVVDFVAYPFRILRNYLFATHDTSVQYLTYRLVQN